MIDLVIVRSGESEEAKVSLAMGAEMAGTGICSGEGVMLGEEREANSRYFGGRVREIAGGIPVGFKISAQHIEKDSLREAGGPTYPLRRSGADYLGIRWRGGVSHN